MTDSLPNLTPKQEKALTHFRLHGNKSAAYRHAYVAERMSSKTVNRKAVALFNHGKVRAWVNWHKEQDQEEFSIERSVIMEKLDRIADMGMEQLEDPYGKLRAENLTAATSALKEINAMQGNHAPAQTIVSGPGGGPVKVTREWVVNPVKPGPIRERGKE